MTPTQLELHHAQIRLRRASTAIKSWKHSTWTYTGGESTIDEQKFAFRKLIHATLTAAHPNIITLYKKVPRNVFGQVNHIASLAYREADSAWRSFTASLVADSTDILSSNAVRQFAIAEVMEIDEKTAKLLAGNLGWDFQEIIDELNSDKKIDFGFEKEDNEQTAELDEFIRNHV